MDRGIGPEQGNPDDKSGRRGRSVSGNVRIDLKSSNDPDPPPSGGDPGHQPYDFPSRPADYIFLLRPMILLPVWTFFLLGAHHGSTVSGKTISPGHLLSGLFSFTSLLGAIYIINQIADSDTDLANKKLFLIPHSIISLKAAWIEAVSLIAVSFLVGLFLLPPGFSVILLLGLALGAAYSLEPVRLKRRPVLDVLANAAGNGILNTLAGWIAVGATVSGWRILLPYPLAVASVHLATTLADIEGDSRSGFKTSGVTLGPRLGIMISTFLMIAAAASATAVNNRPAFYASLLSLPVFLIPARSIRRACAPSSILLPAKSATLIFSVTAGFLFPLYIPFAAIVILLTRIYYGRRFGISYPSFF